MGVQVTAVQGTGKTFGMRVNDIIISLNQQDIKSVEGFNNMVKDLETGDAAVIYVIRGDLRQFVSIEIAP